MPSSAHKYISTCHCPGVYRGTWYRFAYNNLLLFCPCEFLTFVRAVTKRQIEGSAPPTTEQFSYCPSMWTTPSWSLKNLTGFRSVGLQLSRYCGSPVAPTADSEYSEYSEHRQLGGTAGSLACRWPRLRLGQLLRTKQERGMDDGCGLFLPMAVFRFSVPRA
jgi:hypothetical protein